MYVIHVVHALICHVSSIDEVDEFWCDHANKTTPLDLAQGTNTAFTVSDINQPTTAPASANIVLVTPALLLISALIAALSI